MKDFRGQYINRYIAQDELSSHDFEGAVFYACSISEPPERMLEQLSNWQALHFNCLSVRNNTFNFADLRCKLQDAEISECSISGEVSATAFGGTTDLATKLNAVCSPHFKMCTFENVTVDIVIKNRSLNALQLFKGESNTFEKCEFSLENTFFDTAPSRFDSCKFSKLFYFNTHPYDTTFNRLTSYSSFFEESTFKNCIFSRVRFIQLVARSGDLRLYSSLYKQDFKYRYFEATKKNKSSSYDVYDECLSLAKEDCKERFRDCEFNILFPIAQHGQESIYSRGTLDRLQPSFENIPTTEAMTFQRFQEPEYTTNLLNEDDYSASVFRYMSTSDSKRNQTLEQFLTDIRLTEERFEDNVFERFTGYPRQILEIAKKITFSFWHYRVNHLILTGNTSYPTQNFEFVPTVSEITKCSFSNLSLSLKADVLSDRDYTRLGNTEFVNCKLIFENLLIYQGVVFEDCMFEDNVGLWLDSNACSFLRSPPTPQEYETILAERKPVIIFRNCDLRGVCLFKDRKVTPLVASSAVHAIRDRFIVFENCILDETTTVESYSYRRDVEEYILHQKPVLDILAQAPMY